ncbi:response regulator transcription factor [Streptomyces olivaceoviridis]|uniref:response regulator transcription factor n=1 Tax=Streptomyces olivaceoviridis TaxID=1921 RepID=UPI0036FBC9E1
MTAPVQVGPSSPHGGPAPSCDRILSNQLRQVLQLAANGYSNKRIGGELHKTENTVKSQMAKIMRILHANDRAQAVAVGARLGLITIGDGHHMYGPPSVEQLMILVARAERKGALSDIEGNRLREGIRYLATKRSQEDREAAEAENILVAELRRKYSNARKEAWRWKQQAAESGGGEAQDALRRVVELARRWKNIPAKRQAGVSVLAVIANRYED